MIKSLQPEELPLAYPCARAFFAAANLPGRLDLKYWSDRWAGFIQAGVGVMFAAVQGGTARGFIAGLLSPCLATGDPWLSEVYWFVLPEHRGGRDALELFNAFERWGAERGAKAITFGNMEHLTPGPLSKLYERRGYRRLETHWIKVSTNQKERPDYA